MSYSKFINYTFNYFFSLYIFNYFQVNDFFVCNAWKDFVGANDKVHVLADPFANFTKVLGLDIDTPFAGIRCKRFSAIVENGVITIFNLEEGGYGLTCSLSNALLSAL